MKRLASLLQGLAGLNSPILGSCSAAPVGGTRGQSVELSAASAGEDALLMAAAYSSGLLSDEGDAS